LGCRNPWAWKVPFVSIQSTICECPKYHLWVFKVPFVSVQSTICECSRYHLWVSKVPFMSVQGTICECPKYHLWVSKVPFLGVQGTIVWDTIGLNYLWRQSIISVGQNSNIFLFYCEFRINISFRSCLYLCYIHGLKLTYFNYFYVGFRTSFWEPKSYMLRYF
jgi:hypothetical protein